MRHATFVLAMLIVTTGVWADPSNLSGGVLIAHHDPAYTWSPPVPYCDWYTSHPINGQSQVINTLSGGLNVWYVLAAWEYEAKTWCGTEFGFGAFNTDLFYLVEYGPCFPATGLEIPSPGWPGPNEGTAFVTTGSPWSGNWLAVYFFAGYAYGYTYGATAIPIGIDPPTAFCGFSNCENPPMVYSVPGHARGAMGVNMPGYTPSFYGLPDWACCFTEAPYCRMLPETDCLLQGGTWLGPEWTCNPDPCPHPGACCLIGACSIMFAENCLLVGGTFLGPDTLCEPNPCPAVCCFDIPVAPHGCEVMLEDDCLAAQGFWHPQWNTCDPNPCVIYTPIQHSSWGRIKSMYR